MLALLKSMQNDHPAQPVLVISNVPNAGGLDKALAHGVATGIADHQTFGKDRIAFEAELQRQLVLAKPDIICLAGFMRILSGEFVDKWPGQILNIHPSLLPRYPGLHTHQRALEAGDRQHGASVHLVTPDLDAGPILGQISMPIYPDDTAQSLAQRLVPLEHRLYPAVLHRFAFGDLTRLDMV